MLASLNLHTLCRMVFIFYKQPHLYLPYTVVANAIKLVGIAHVVWSQHWRPGICGTHVFSLVRVHSSLRMR